MMRRRPAAAGAAALLLLLLAFAQLVGVGGLLLLLEVQTGSCGGLPIPTMARRQQGAEEKARLGSRPPSCRGKCYACSPCRAVQVPSTDLQVATATATATPALLSNYKPLGWKCQCRDRLYHP